MASFGQLFESAGNLSSVQKEKDGLSISFPNGKVRVTVYSATVFRIHFYPSSIINLAAGLQGAFVVNRSKGVLS